MRIRILTMFLVASLFTILGGGVAAAQAVDEDYPVDTDDVLEIDEVNDDGAAADADALASSQSADAEVLSASTSSGLPVTGGDVVALSAIGVAMIAIGAVLVSRRNARI